MHKYNANTVPLGIAQLNSSVRFCFKMVIILKANTLYDWYPVKDSYKITQ
jgi:hypothetical protein